MFIYKYIYICIYMTKDKGINRKHEKLKSKLKELKSKQNRLPQIDFHVKQNGGKLSTSFTIYLTREKENQMKKKIKNNRK